MRRIFEILANSTRAPWLLALGAAACMAFVAVWFGGLNQDEGWYLYAAQMVRAGQVPYRDFFFTQGPAMPYVYAALSPLWHPASPLHGLLGGRVATLALGGLALFCGIGLVRRLVPRGRRSLAALTLFAVLGCNLYHLYFTTIPKTYALGSLFLLGGFLLVARGLEAAAAGRGGALRGGLCLAAGGFSLALASGTRISLLLVLPVAGVTLLAGFRRFGWGFLWFGMGGMLGLGLTYGVFACDPVARGGLLAAQKYHAARGGFDPFFALGSVSRLARGYAALGAVLFAAACLGRPAAGGKPEEKAEEGTACAQNALRWMLGLGFLAVFLLQLSAPFPYDDYQVPIMGLLAVLLASLFARRAAHPVRAGWFAVLVACLVSFASPLLQEWATYGQDRFWSQKREMTALAKLRRAGRAVQALDPGGTTLLTQDLYLAVEAGRTVPAGMEMGPFCYFPDLGTEEARVRRVMNRERMTRLLESAPCALAACSGYAFAIGAPVCGEVPPEEQARFRRMLRQRYDVVDEIPDFGQNATTLQVLRRKKEADAR